MMFPLLYHAHHSRHLEDLPFWLQLAQEQGDPILELGCGSGRVLLPLAQAGFRLVGLDNNPAMLALLRKNNPPEQSLVLVGDIRAFHLALRFPFIMIPCNTWSTLEAGERQSALACIRHHLPPGGIFAASLPNPATLVDLPARGEAEVEESFPHPLTGHPVQVSSAWQRARRRFTVTWHYDHLLPDGRLERFTAQAHHSLASIESYCAEFEVAGLSPTVHGDFNFAPYSPASPEAILVGRLE